MSGKDVIRAIEAAGWYEVRQKSSHKPFKHPTLPGLVTAPHPKRNIPLGMLKNIEKEAGIKLYGVTK